MKNLTAQRSSRRNFILFTGLFMTVLFLSNYTGEVNKYNATMYALTYRYTFGSRSLLGSFYHLIDALLPADMISYHAVQIFTTVMTLLLFLLLFCFAVFVIKRTSGSFLLPMEFLLMLLILLIVPTFTETHNFGRVDLYMLTISALAAVLLIREKAVWLVIPLSAIGCMAHQGYVFMYFNIILVLLLYRCITSEEQKKKRTYALCFVISLVLTGSLFIWFELFSHNQGIAVYNDVVAEAQKLTLGGEYHEPLLRHEIRGVDLTESEADWHRRNLVELLCFIPLTLPFSIPLFDLFGGCVKRAGGFWRRILYLLILIGSLTLLPDFALKVDFGRWTIAFIFYYLMMMISLLLMKDPLFLQEGGRVLAKIKGIPLLPVFLIVYAFVFVPFWDINYNLLIAKISSFIGDGRLWPVG